MGSGRYIKCKNCGKEYMVNTGIGMLFPVISEEAINNIRNGIYGEELMNLFFRKPYLVVDCELDLYVCECGHWDTEENLDIYEPVDDELRKKREEEAAGGYNRYVLRKDLKKDYRLVRHHKHICSKCGKEMKRIRRPDYYAIRYGLNCPYCGEKNKATHESIVLWD